MHVPQRGRAIVRRLSAHETVRAFRPGDFLLTSSSGALARLQGLATGSRLNHAAVIVDPLGTVVEANPCLLVDAHLYRTSSVGEYLKAGKPCWIGYVELREGTRQDVVAYAEQFARNTEATSLAGQLVLALHTIGAVAPRAWAARFAWLRPLHGALDRHALILRIEGCYSSGELVARALERGGFMWDRDPAHVTPYDLYRRYHLDETPTQVAPLRFDRGRRAAAAPTTAHAKLGQAPITQLTPRTGVQGATVLATAPRRVEEPQRGLHALLQVSALAAAGLMVIGLAEELIRLLAPET
jgi:hypothetical protein